jgi:hypothetical protein
MDNMQNMAEGLFPKSIRDKIATGPVVVAGSDSTSLLSPEAKADSHSSTFDSPASISDSARFQMAQTGQSMSEGISDVPKHTHHIRSTLLFFILAFLFGLLMGFIGQTLNSRDYLLGVLLVTTILTIFFAIALYLIGKISEKNGRGWGVAGWILIFLILIFWIFWSA